MRRAIVDTSIFIDFLRGKSVPRLKVLLQSNSVLLSRFVRLELLQGMRLEEAGRMNGLLRGVPQVPHLPNLFEVAEELGRKIKGIGFNIGLIDLLIAAEAKLMRCQVYSADKVFAVISRHDR